MILVDSRSGSRELLPYLKALRTPAKHTMLEYGDFAMKLRGPDDELVTVGLERKTLSDLVTSIQSGRLSGHQLPGLVKAYDFPLLIIEGTWRPAVDGSIEVLFTPKNQKPEKKEFGFWLPFRGQMLYSAVSRALFTFLLKARVPWIRTMGVRETAQVLFDLHQWGQKGWDEHRAHLGTDRTFDPRPDRLLWREPNFVAQVARSFPGIWDVRSEAAAKQFATVEEMVNAPIEDWVRIDGVGLPTATRLWKKLREPQGKRSRRGRLAVDDRDAARPRFRKEDNDDGGR